MDCVRCHGLGMFDGARQIGGCSGAAAVVVLSA